MRFEHLQVLPREYEADIYIYISRRINTAYYLTGSTRANVDSVAVRDARTCLVVDLHADYESGKRNPARRIAVTDKGESAAGPRSF